MRVSRTFMLLAAVALLGVACKDNITTAIPAGLSVFTATLNGANEKPTAVTTTARGSAIVTILGNQLSWKVDITSAIDSITAGHIHHAPIDSAGGVRVNFTPAPTGVAFTGTATQGSIVVADSIIAFIQAGNSYVNIHTKKNGAGEIRGQLIKQ
jgi:hypothetical protein